MTNIDRVAPNALKTLFSDVVSAERFRNWKASDAGVAGMLSTYTMGEIYWRKAIGRPHTASLSEGFVIEAWRDEMILVGQVGGAAHWQPVKSPYFPSWWDGKDDGEYWRVPFMIPNLKDGRSSDGAHDEYTHIEPHFRENVWWRVPGGRFGIGSAGHRAFEPDKAVFVKLAGAVHLCFEVVTQALVTIDRHGVAGP